MLSNEAGGAEEQDKPYSLTERGWPPHAGQPMAFQALALQVPHPGQTLSPGWNGTLVTLDWMKTHINCNNFLDSELQHWLCD